MDSKLDTFYNNEYFKINKILQEAVGLWPYNTRSHKIIRRIIVLIVLGSVGFPHMNAVRIWCGVHLGLCAENLSGVMYALAVFSKYIVTILYENKIRQVYEQVAETWMSIKDPQEQAIMIKYAKIGKLKSVGYVGYLIIAGISFSQLGIVPVIMDLIIPLNESRPKIQIVKAEFFVDPSDYYYEIYFAYCIIASVSVTVLMAIDTTYTAVIHQNLGIFNVIKHRLKLTTQHANTDKTDVYDSVVSVIQLHQYSLKFHDQLESTYDILFLILIIYHILFLTFGAITIMENSKIILDLIRMSLFEVGAIIHLFYLSWPGQLVISESSDLFVYTYLNEWYNASEKAKTLLKIMMLRCIKPCYLTAAGLSVMSFENYGAIIKTTMSYIMVLASFR